MFLPLAALVVAQTAAPAPSGDGPWILAAGGVIAGVVGLIQIGDRLWKPRKGTASAGSTCSCPNPCFFDPEKDADSDRRNRELMAAMLEQGRAVLQATGDLARTTQASAEASRMRYEETLRAMRDRHEEMLRLISSFEERVRREL